MSSNQTLIRFDSSLIYFGDVHVGRSAAVGTPKAAERWIWFCGFYPGSNPGEQTRDIAVTLDGGMRTVASG